MPLWLNIFARFLDPEKLSKMPVIGGFRAIICGPKIGQRKFADLDGLLLFIRKDAFNIGFHRNFRGSILIEDRLAYLISPT
jgi:hypothetical protein